MAMDAQALVEAGRQVDQARLPLWSSTKDSAFTAEQWIERISRARNAGNWNEQVTMSYVFNALRGDALTFFDALPTLGYNQAVFDDFKEAFLKTYGTTRTVRTAALNLTDIRQGATESAARYISRVIKIVSDIQAMAPDVLPGPAAPWTAAVRAVVAFVALPDAAKTAQAQRLLKHGAQDAYHRLGMQLFIAGLKPILRTELMKSNPQTMRQAFDAVIDAEKIISEPLKTAQKAHIMGVQDADENDFAAQNDSEQEEDDEGDSEIAALSAKLKKLKKKSQAKRNKQSGGQNNGQRSQNGGQNRTPNRNNNRNNDNKPGACRYCKKEGHFQAECYARKSAGAPMVDAQGQPFRAAGVHALSDQQQQQMQMQQQQQQQHFGYNPFAHYARTDEQAGGIGAIWQRQPPPRYGGGEQASFYEASLNY